MSYLALVYLIRSMYPTLDPVSARGVADTHADWHEREGIDDEDLSVSQCKCAIRIIVEGEGMKCTQLGSPTNAPTSIYVPTLRMIVRHSTNMCDNVRYLGTG